MWRSTTSICLRCMGGRGRIGTSPTPASCHGAARRGIISSMQEYMAIAVEKMAPTQRVDAMTKKRASITPQLHPSNVMHPNVMHTHPSVMPWHLPGFAHTAVLLTLGLYPTYAWQGRPDILQSSISGITPPCSSKARHASRRRLATSMVLVRPAGSTSKKHC